MRSLPGKRYHVERPGSTISAARLVQEGALAKIRVLIMAGAGVLEAATLDKITAWVSAGGLLFVLDSRPQDWDGANNSFDALLGFAPGSDEIRGITEMTVNEAERLPSLARFAGSEHERRNKKTRNGHRTHRNPRPEPAQNQITRLNCSESHSERDAEADIITGREGNGD